MTKEWRCGTYARSSGMVSRVSSQTSSCIRSFLGSEILEVIEVPRDNHRIGTKSMKIVVKVVINGDKRLSYESVVPILHKPYDMITHSLEGNIRPIQFHLAC